MLSLREIKKNLEMTKLIKELAFAYQEIANLRMKQFRETVLRNREFFNILVETFLRIQRAYFLELKRKKKRLERKRKLKDEVVVFLSSNESLYGTLIWDIWHKVREYLEKNKVDLIVIGKLGKYIAERSGYGMKMFYFHLDDVKPKTENIEEVAQFIKNYRKVVIFYGKYEGRLVQKPATKEIAGGFLEKEKIKEGEYYIFEPSPEEVLDFFETEIFAVLFNLTLLEHQLARCAARVMAMSETVEKAKKLERSYFVMENKIKRDLLTKKQIELFGGLIS
jgi:ATP synthase F1 gamma subunit